MQIDTGSICRCEYKTALNIATATSALELRTLTVVGAVSRTNAGKRSFNWFSNVKRLKEMRRMRISRVYDCLTWKPHWHQRLDLPIVSVKNAQ